jgi:hypothetical protein
MSGGLFVATGGGAAEMATSLLRKTGAIVPNLLSDGDYAQTHPGAALAMGAAIAYVLLIVVMALVEKHVPGLGAAMTPLLNILPLGRRIALFTTSGFRATSSALTPHELDRNNSGMVLRRQTLRDDTGTPDKTAYADEVAARALGLENPYSGTGGF